MKTLIIIDNRVWGKDKARIQAFFGQIRDRLILLLNDMRERLVPDIIDWYLTECDINKDIKVSDILHFSAIKVQLKHLDHLFSIYIKSMGKDTVCRVEERKHFAAKPTIEVINDVFNPADMFAAQLNEIKDNLARLVNNRGMGEAPQ